MSVNLLPPEHRIPPRPSRSLALSCLSAFIVTLGMIIGHLAATIIH